MMESKLYNKLYAQRIHAKKRAIERYGLELNQEDFKKLNDLARSSPVIKRMSNRLTLRKMVFNEDVIRVIYDSHRNQIVTFLPQKREDFI
jgi:hypothetical protein